MIWFITSKIGRILSAIVAAGASILAIFYAGKREARKDQEIKDLEEYKHTKEDIDEAKPSLNRKHALKRLSGRKQLRKRDM